MSILLAPSQSKPRAAGKYATSHEDRGSFDPKAPGGWIVCSSTGRAGYAPQTRRDVCHRALARLEDVCGANASFDSVNVFYRHPFSDLGGLLVRGAASLWNGFVELDGMSAVTLRHDTGRPAAGGGVREASVTLSVRRHGDYP